MVIFGYYTADIIAAITSVYIQAIEEDSSHPIFEEKDTKTIRNTIYLGCTTIEDALFSLGKNKNRMIFIFSYDEEPTIKLPPELLFHKVKNNMLASAIEVFGNPKEVNPKVNRIQLDKILALFNKENKKDERQSKLKTQFILENESLKYIGDIISQILNGNVDLDDFISGNIRKR